MEISQETENLKRKKQKILELKTITEMKISLEGFKGRFEQAKESVNLK